MSYILIGIGGMLGSITRYALGKWISGKWDTIIPLKTFAINVTGAFLLGLVVSLNVSNNYYLILAEGYLGAYTTFSTFMYEGFNLFRNDKLRSALIYILGTILLGFVGFAAGVEAGSILKTMCLSI